MGYWKLVGPDADLESSRRGASSGILDLYVGHEEVSFLKNGAREVIDLEYCKFIAQPDLNCAC